MHTSAYLSCPPDVGVLSSLILVCCLVEQSCCRPDEPSVSLLHALPAPSHRVHNQGLQPSASSRACRVEYCRHWLPRPRASGRVGLHAPPPFALLTGAATGLRGHWSHLTTHSSNDMALLTCAHALVPAAFRPSVVCCVGRPDSSINQIIDCPSNLTCASARVGRGLRLARLATGCSRTLNGNFQCVPGPSTASHSHASVPDSSRAPPRAIQISPGPASALLTECFHPRLFAS